MNFTVLQDRQLKKYFGHRKSLIEIQGILIFIIYKRENLVTNHCPTPRLSR